MTPVKPLGKFKKFLLMVIAFLLITPFSKFLLEYITFPGIMVVAGLLLLYAAPQREDLATGKGKRKKFYLLIGLGIIVIGVLDYLNIFSMEIINLGLGAIGVLLIILAVLGDRDIDIGAAFPRTPY